MNAPVSVLRKTYDKLFINGEWTMPHGGREDVISPVTEAVVGYAPLGTVVDADRALAAARAAFDTGPWPEEDRNVRADKMQRLFDRAQERREEALGLM